VTRPVRLAVFSALMAVPLVLSACSADNNAANSASASGSSTGAITCASGTLNASGSTAQANAMSAWTKAYQTACTGASSSATLGLARKGAAS